MCGRFTLTTPLNVLMQQFLFEWDEAISPRYNIAPTQPVLSLRWNAAAAGREATTLKWGLIPSWSKDAKIGYRMINARGETVDTKPSFRAAFAKRRCLILADGYFEWKKMGAIKQPYWIQLDSEQPFAMAGLWESWRAPTGEAIESCTIITTDANEATQVVHDRMPVILPQERHDAWLDPDFADQDVLRQWLTPCAVYPMKVRPVSTHVNNVRNADAKCVELIAEQAIDQDVS